MARRKDPPPTPTREQLEAVWTTHTKSEIADMFDLSTGTIYNLGVRYGLPPREMKRRSAARATPPSREELEPLWSTHTFAQLAAKFGYASAAGIRNVGLALGLPDRDRKPTLTSRAAALRAPATGPRTTQAVQDDLDSDIALQDAPSGLSVDPRIDPVAAQAKADAADLDMIRRAARKHSAGLNAMVHLVGVDYDGTGRQIMARCVGKGWVRLGPNPFAAHAVQTFEVLAAGYRAAGMKVPPFAS